jgi:hypothetical protein
VNIQDILTILTMILQADVYIYILLGLIAVNFLSAVAVAIKRREFDWSRLADVYGRDVLPKVLGYVVIRIAVAWLAGTPLADVVEQSAATAAFAVISTSLLARIFGHWYELGLIPEPVARGVRVVMDRLRLRPAEGPPVDWPGP